MSVLENRKNFPPKLLKFMKKSVNLNENVNFTFKNQQKYEITEKVKFSQNGKIYKKIIKF